MTSPELVALLSAIAPVIREYVSQTHIDLMGQMGTLKRELDAAQERILELETRPAMAGSPGERGLPGAGIGTLVISAEGHLLAHLTDGRSVDAGPVPQGPPGRDGARGEKGEPGVGECGAQGERGLSGASGERGQDGATGEQGPTGQDGAAGLNGKDGAPGLDGKDGSHGLNGKDGAPGLNGKDGAPGERGLTGEKGLDGMHGRDGRDGAHGQPGEKGLDGRDGANGLNGTDGIDGLGFDNYDLYLDETRGWIFSLAGGDRHKEWELGIPFDAKVWAAGTVYPKGAGTTWDGHYWIALQQTSAQPGEGSPDWRLAVRRGKQGREGKQGKDGSPGRDLTQTDPATGRKW